MNARTFFLTLSAVTVLSACTANHVPREPAIWILPVNNFEVMDVTLSQAVETLVKQFKKQYPDDTRLGGYLIRESPESVAEVTASLWNVPFGEACHIVAEAAGWQYTLHERTLCFFPSGTGYYSEVTDLLPLSSKVQHALGLSMVSSSSELKDRMSDLKIRVLSFSSLEIVEYESSTYVLVSGYQPEVEALKSLWKLLDRGFALERTGSGSNCLTK